MKKVRRRVKGFLAVSLLVCVIFGISVKAAGISPMLLENNQCTLYLSISNNSAACSVYVKGKSGTSSISGKLKLYDVTAGRAASSALNGLKDYIIKTKTDWNGLTQSTKNLVEKYSTAAVI